MGLQIFIALFLLFRLRKTLQTFYPNPKREKMIVIVMICIGVFAILENIFNTDHVTKWVWHIVLLSIVVIAFQKQEFYADRITIYAVLPLILISLVSDILGTSGIDFFGKVSKYMEYAYPVAITWMIALLIRSRKQRKNLLEARKKREEEIRELQQMTERKAELETVVKERTTELVKQKEELQQALNDLTSTQAQLVQREKMASLGELTAGIAHEIQNPLNFVNNFSELSVELSDELQQELDRLPIADAEKMSLVHFINDIKNNQQKINYHGKRADAIVKGMLLHSRKSTGLKEPTDINLLADEYMQLSYHGLRAKDKSFNAAMQKHFDDTLGKIKVVPQDMGRVFLNLFTNAFYSVTEKKKELGEGLLPDGKVYEPVVSVYTKKLAGQVEIRIKDNGTGMSQKILDKIYQPFFTTKPTGQGTGLGLSISYDIITKIHEGQMTVNTKEGEFAEFIILLPAYF